MKKTTLFVAALGTAGILGGIAVAQDESTRDSAERDRPGRQSEEGDRPPREGGDREAFFAMIDADMDGKISKEEFVAFSVKAAEERFGRMDEDGDGFVGKEELRPPRGARGPREGDRARGPREGDRPGGE